ncbi:MAG: hypothetical protein GQ582_05580 [Methyloprofundus sp.]|nr:hypothetical protein [Methyloprofundus sp.]
MQQPASELYKIASETTAKYIYFLLATAGAAIAYSIEVANDSNLSSSLFLLMLAILSWMLSFYNGCKSIQYDISVHNLSFDIQQETEIIKNTEKRLSEQEFADIRKSYEENIEPWNQALSKHGSQASLHLVKQFRFLIIGGGAFVAWRITEFVVKASIS